MEYADFLAVSHRSYLRIRDVRHIQLLQPTAIILVKFNSRGALKAMKQVKAARKRNSRRLKVILGGRTCEIRQSAYCIRLLLLQRAGEEDGPLLLTSQ